MKLRLSPDTLALNPALGRTVQTSERAARIPKADADERVGLDALLRAGWSTESPDCVRYRLTKRGVGDTQMCETLKAACDRAKAMEQEAG